MAIKASFVADFTSFYSAVDKAQVQLRSFEDNANKVGNSLNRMVDQFSGRKLIQEATLMAESVQRVGGASKLTDTELKRVAAVTGEAAAKMKALGIDVPKSFHDIAEAAKRVKEPVEGISTKMIALGTAAGTFIGRIAYDAVKALAGSMLELAANGIKMAPVVSAFEKLTAGIGETADAMLRTTRTATKGLITDLDIMAAANKAMLLGLPISSKEMGVLGAAAVTLGKAMKQDAAKSLDDLIISLGRSSPLILDNLGLTVKVGEANETYARQVGKTSAQLTDAEKKLAFYNAAMDAAKVKVEQLGGVQLTLADQVLRVKNQFKNFTDALGVAIARSPVLNDLMGKIADGIGSAFGENQITRVQNLVKWVNEAAVSAVGFAQDLVSLAKHGTATWTFLKDGVLGLLEAQFRVRAGIRDLIPTQKYKEEAIILRAMADDLKKQADEANAKQKQLNTTLDGMSGRLGALQARLRELGHQQVSNADIATDLAAGLNETGHAADDNGKKFKKLADNATAFGAAVVTTIPRLETYGKHLKDVQGTISSYDVLLFQAKATTDAFGRVTYTQAVPSLGEMGTAAAQAQLRLADVDDEMGTLTKTLQGFPALVVKAFTGGGGLKGAINAFGAQIGSSLFGEDGAFNRATKAAKNGLSKVFGSTVGDAFGAAIPGIGALIGPAFEKLAGWIGSLFGNKTKDAIVESFGTYDALREKLNALGAEGERMWIRLTQQTGRNDLASTKAQIDEITKALALQESAMDILDETAKKYGFTIEELGPAWQRQELGKKAQELFKDYQILVSAGVDNVKVLEKMAGAVNEYVKNAVKMGQEVPEAMRPMLEEMVKTGKLMDENGNIITDLEAAGIKFALSMSDGFKMLIAEVQKLTDAIARSLGTAIKNIPDGEFDIHGKYHPPKNLPKDSDLAQPSGFATGTMGRYLDFGAGTLAMLHGKERVMTEAEGKAEAGLLDRVLSGGDGGPNVTVNINAAGAFFDTPQSLQRLADKVSAALTADLRRQSRYAAA